MCGREGGGGGKEVGKAYPVYGHLLFDDIEGCFYLETLSGGQGCEGLIGGFDFSLDGSDAERHFCERVSSIWIVLGPGCRTDISSWPLCRAE